MKPKSKRCVKQKRDTLHVLKFDVEATMNKTNITSSQCHLADIVCTHNYHDHRANRNELSRYLRPTAKLAGSFSRRNNGCLIGADYDRLAKQLGYGSYRWQTDLIRRRIRGETDGRRRQFTPHADPIASSHLIVE